MPHLGPGVVLQAEVNSEILDPLFLAAVEEAVINALDQGGDGAAVRPRGLIVRGIDTERLAAMFR